LEAGGNGLFASVNYERQLTKQPGIGLETVKRGIIRNHSITTLSRSEIEIQEKKSLNRILGA
jgi:hypothetical protein